MSPSLCSLLALSAFLADPAAARNIHGGIEIGGRGVKATVLEVHPGGIYRSLFSRTHNTTLSALDDGNAFRPAAIEDAVKAIASFHRTFRETYKLPPERIHVVGSSGVPKAVNRADFVKAVKKAIGKDLTFIDEKTEVALTISGVIPRAERDAAVSLDIGGGNTKGGYQPVGKPLVYMAIPLGSVTFTEKVREHAKANGTSLGVAAAALRGPILVKPLRDGARAMPELAKRKKVYLSGGMIWAMITLVRPESIDDALVTFSTADVKAFRKAVSGAGGKFPAIDLGKIKDEGQKLRASAAAAVVSKAYKIENLIAGAEILAALVEAFDLEDHVLVFPRNAVYGWLAAYVTGAAGV